MKCEVLAVRLGMRNSRLIIGDMLLHIYRQGWLRVYSNRTNQRRSLPNRNQSIYLAI
jgi:hypothetical protein